MLAAAGAWLVVVAAVCGGIGWLYLLRQRGAIAAGPRLGGALPLLELAKSGSQPLLRMVAAWLPAGIAAGVAVGVLTRLRAPVAAAGCGLVAALLLGPANIASEAVIHNERFSAHIGPALSRPGVWTAVALMATGALLSAALVRAQQARASSAAAGRASAAA